jgi:electron transfer flavoprotein beta subunit
MRTLVAFQITEELESLQSRSVRIVDGCKIDTSFLTRSIDCYDASALELAIQLSEESESCHCPFEIEAVTADNHPVESVLKTLYALRFDRVINAYRENGSDLASADIARAICRVATEDRADLLLFGRQNSIGNQGSLPYAVADMLKIPAFSEVTGVHLVAEGLLKVCCLTDSGSSEYEVRPPAVLLIGNAESAFLRYPTLKDKMKYKDRQVIRLPVDEKWEGPDFPLKNEALKTGLRVVDRSRKSRIVREETDASAHYLLEEYLRKFHGQD